MSWDLATPFIIDLQVQAEDIDGFGHANNAAYVVWLERCAWRHSQRLGLDLTESVVLTAPWPWPGMKSITWPAPMKVTSCNWRRGSSIATNACA